MSSQQPTLTTVDKAIALRTQQLERVSRVGQQQQQFNDTHYKVTTLPQQNWYRVLFVDVLI